jgi:hypothetical protein
MARLPPSKLTDQERHALLVLVALGTCGWSIVVELLLALERRKLLTHRQGRRVVAGAANAVQELIDIGGHPVLDVALAILRGEIDGWEPPAE